MNEAREKVKQNRLRELAAKLMPEDKDTEYEGEEPLTEDDVESSPETDEEFWGTLTGSASRVVSSSSPTSSSGVFSGVPYPTTSRGGIKYGPTTSGSGSWTPPGVAEKAVDPVLDSRFKRMVSMPGRFTQKVLVAFLDPDKTNSDDTSDVLWAKTLHAEQFEMILDQGETKLVVTFSLEDVYASSTDED